MGVLENHGRQSGLMLDLICPSSRKRAGCNVVGSAFFGASLTSGEMVDSRNRAACFACRYIKALLPVVTTSNICYKSRKCNRVAHILCDFLYITRMCIYNWLEVGFECYGLY